MLKSASLRKVSLGAAAAAAAVTALAAGPSSAAVVGAAATVAPPVHVGACPFMFKFTGKIVSNSQGVVKYRWIRSDGAIAPVQTLFFREPGTQFVSTTWTLSPPHYVGWEAIRILTPNPLISNKAVFKLTCLGPNGGPIPNNNLPNR
jgi:hypothetical protein